LHLTSREVVASLTVEREEGEVDQPAVFAIGELAEIHAVTHTNATSSPTAESPERRKAVELDLHPTLLAVCRLPAEDAVPSWADQVFQPLVSITRTADELSVVLPQAEVPPDVQAEAGWRALSVRGPLPFHLTGVLASLAVPLADAGVPIFALSTHDTDWLLVGHDRLDDACAALGDAGHRIHGAIAPAGETSD
jgi:uncharacterized protein